MMAKTTAIRYGWLGFSLAMLGIPLYVYLPAYYAEHSQLSLSAIGAALLLARAMDVVTDPLMGWWSDRWAVRISRVNQILLGGAFLVLGVYQLWLMDVATLSWTELFFWSFVTYLAWTAVSIPYLALSAEISPHKHDKTWLSSAREGFAILGVILVLTLPLMSGKPADSADFYRLMFILFVAAFLLGLILLRNLKVLERQPFVSTDRSPWRVLSALWKEERQVFSVMPSYFLNNLANAIPATLFLTFVADYLQLKSLTGAFLLVYFLAGIVSLPMWMKLSKASGKLFAWRLSMLLASLSFMGVFWLDAGDADLFFAICVLTGLSLGVDVAMPASIQADMTQEVKSENTAGLLFGLWGMLTKMALALAVGLAFPLLELGKSFGFYAMSLLILYAGLPIILKVVAMIISQRAFKRFG